ncbi:dynamin family protein [Cereibacter sediminicola]|uniref:dynamin family protein n=1 Tax=Cereibacter sediminicola TaxID=2584941 RepID=UPI00119F4A3C|nr:dynamin family protein [Cereibacter sediminicola]
MNLPLELSQIVGKAAEVTCAAEGRPRIMIAGEFSSGKTRLVNALLGHEILPSSVTSTALPPVWIRHGDGAPECVRLDGQVQAFASVPELVAHVQAVDLDRIHHCRICHPHPLLERFDLIDTPGNSDPNIPAASWERMVAEADMIVWCSPAVQAWRQSERSAWLSLPEAVTGPGLLLLSQADKLADPDDRDKVMRRVLREAEGLFASVRMASFLSETDVEELRAALVEASAALPRRARPVPLAQAEDGLAAPRIMPRRIRTRPVASEPLLLVARAPDAAPEALRPSAYADADGALPVDSHAEVADTRGLEEVSEPRGVAPEARTGTAEANPDDAGAVIAAASARAAEPQVAEADGVVLTFLRDRLEAAEPPLPDEPAAPAPDADLSALIATHLPTEATPATCAEAQESVPASPATGMSSSVSEPPVAPSADAEPRPSPLASDTPPAGSEEPFSEPAVAPDDRQDDPAPVRRPQRATLPAMMFGPARMLWEQILPTLDPDDTDSILGGVDELIAELDLTWARACLQSAPAASRRRGSA